MDVAYGLEVVEAFGRGREGITKLIVTKDRPGFVRQHADRGHVADLKLFSLSDGRVVLELTAPTAEDAPFRPTTLMERVSRALEQEPGLSKRGVRDTVSGKGTAKDLALAVLIREEYVRIERHGTATHHHVVRPYRQADEASPCPRVPSVSPACPDTGVGDRVPVSPPTGDTDTGHGQGSIPELPDRVPPGESLP